MKINSGTSKPLIALITNNDDDVYCFRKELIEAFIEEGYEVLISCPEGPKFDLMKGIPFKYDNPEIDRRGTNIISDSKLLFHYYKLLKREKPIVVLTYTAKPNVYAGLTAKALKIPYISNVTGIGSVVNMTGLKKAFILALFKLAYKNATCVMFQNATNMQLALKSRMIKGKYRLIPGSGVDLNRYPVQIYPAGGDGITGEKVIFNYIGRILRDKGVDDYIEAARQIRVDYPETEFNMLGFVEPSEIHYENMLKKLGEQNIVYYRGNQKDIKPWISRAHAIIHPSMYGEGISNVLLENASSGRPIITTNNPGCQDVVNDNVSGYIYKGGSVDCLVKSIKQFLNLSNEERKQMGIAGRKKVEAEFNREIVIKAYLDEISKLRK